MSHYNVYHDYYICLSTTTNDNTNVDGIYYSDYDTVYCTLIQILML